MGGGAENRENQASDGVSDKKKNSPTTATERRTIRSKKDRDPPTDEKPNDSIDAESVLQKIGRLVRGEMDAEMDAETDSKKMKILTKVFEVSGYRGTGKNELAVLEAMMKKLKPKRSVQPEEKAKVKKEEARKNP